MTFHPFISHTCSGISTHHALPGMPPRPSFPRQKDVTLLRGRFVVEMLIVSCLSSIRALLLDRERGVHKLLYQWFVRIFFSMLHASCSLTSITSLESWNTLERNEALRYNIRVGLHPNWTSSGHLRRCSMADTQIKSLSSGIYPSILS